MPRSDSLALVVPPGRECAVLTELQRLGVVL
ncbi:hypothetical protein ABIB81_003635 [Bradyrhizobium sp. I1.7.5]